jgi:hypothetical protein
MLLVNWTKGTFNGRKVPPFEPSINKLCNKMLSKGLPKISVCLSRAVVANSDRMPSMLIDFEALLGIV